MKRRHPLTFEEHQALGAELHSMRSRLNTITVLLSNRYTVAIGDRCGRVVDHLDRLRSDLVDLVFRENPRQETSTLIRVYYPGRPVEQAPKTMPEQPVELER